VRQLDRVLRERLTRAWAAGAGPGDERMVVDVDSFVAEVPPGLLATAPTAHAPNARSLSTAAGDDAMTFPHGRIAGRFGRRQVVRR
jgi:hypothetical protein